MRRIALFALLAFLAGGSQAVSAPQQKRAAQATFAASADAYVTGSARRANFGRARVLRVGPSGGTRAYLRFQVRGLTEPVSRATLRVYARAVARRGIQVRATSGRWSERRVTFRNAPRAGRVVGSIRRVRRGWLSIPLSRAVSGNGTFNFALTGLARVTLSSREGGRRAQLIVETEPPPQTLVAAGDIADCLSNGDEQTAALVNNIPGTVAALGDLAYEDGTAQEFAQCYEPTWGRFKARTRPAAGNHEYHTPGATGYFGYWGAVAGAPTQGWYSYDLGAWHVVVLNSNCTFVGGCHAGSPQETWLRADLAANAAKRCTLGYWHHPRFSSGSVGGSSSVGPLFQALYDANAEALLVGHAHNYQRWVPQNPAGARDDRRGVRQFVVGTGGRVQHPVRPQLPNQEAVNDDTFGVLRLTLRGSAFDWQFVPVAGRTFTDSGSQSCH
jgi:acid phosphatase type 7